MPEATDQTPPAPDRLPPGTVLSDRYRLDELCGAGGMASVYRATDTTLGRTVAVKVIASWLANDDSYARRFLEEARSAAGLNHPGIATVHDAVDEGDRRFIVMEFVDGKRLDELEGLTTEQSVNIAIQVADALTYAHRNGVIHCDIKPANILVEDSGRARLVDFGIARAATETWAMATTVLGTAAYMAPEAVEGMRPAACSDVYSLAMTLYESLAGRLPFSGESAAALTAQRLVKDPIPLSSIADVPADLAETVMKGLERDPAKRTQTAAEFAAELRDSAEALAMEDEAEDAALAPEVADTSPPVGPPTAVQAPFERSAPPTEVEAPFQPARGDAFEAPPPAFETAAHDNTRRPAREQRSWSWLLIAAGLVLLFGLAFFITRSLLDDGEDAEASQEEFFTEMQEAFASFQSRRDEAGMAVSSAFQGDVDLEQFRTAYLGFLRSFREDSEQLAQELSVLDAPGDLAGLKDAYVAASDEMVGALDDFIADAEEVEPQELATLVSDPFDAAKERQSAACFNLQEAAAASGVDVALSCGELSPDAVNAAHESTPGA